MKQYTIGEQSRRFLDAFDVFQKFENVLLDALTATYGEDRGTRFFDEGTPILAALLVVSALDRLARAIYTASGLDAAEVDGRTDERPAL